ncbi:hypothetical protein PO909_019136 [Leuciscus waleckii]
MFIGFLLEDLVFLARVRMECGATNTGCTHHRFNMFSLRFITTTLTPEARTATIFPLNGFSGTLDEERGQPNKQCVIDEAVDPAAKKHMAVLKEHPI